MQFSTQSIDGGRRMVAKQWRRHSRLVEGAGLLKGYTGLAYLGVLLLILAGTGNP